METRQTRENWRPVAGYRGAYEVSDRGRVRKAHSGQIMKPRRDRGGYIRINLTLDKVKTIHKVHRLVAAAFVPGYAEDLQVNHKDANKTNNCADNLEWVTAKGNHDASYNARMMKAKGTHVTQYKTSGEVVAYFFSIREANRVTGIDAEKIGNAVRAGAGGGMAGGYFWKKGFAK